VLPEGDREPLVEGDVVVLEKALDSPGPLPMEAPQVGRLRIDRVRVNPGLDIVVTTVTVVVAVTITIVIIIIIITVIVVAVITLVIIVAAITIAIAIIITASKVQRITGTRVIVQRTSF
jgi:hypothetical protein